MTVTFPATDLDIALLCSADENRVAPTAFEVVAASTPDGSKVNEETNYRGQFSIIDGQVYRILRTQA